jgi:hypothetical protein
MIFQRVCNKSTTMGVTSGAGTAYPKEVHEFTDYDKGKHIRGHL